MVQETRIQELNTKKTNYSKKYVLYWVQNAPRKDYNHALNYSISLANKLKKPLLCVFLLDTSFPFANTRNFTFLIQGLKDFSQNLINENINFFVLDSNKNTKEIKMVFDNACEVVTDMGYLHYYNKRINKYKKIVDCKFTQVETNLIVPVKQVSNKQEYAAYIFRPKIEKLLDEYLIFPPKPKLNVKNQGFGFKGFNIFESSTIKSLKLDNSVGVSKLYNGGENAANKHLQVFVNQKLKNYAEKRNDPSLDFQSNLSPYLHFGFISPIKIALTVKEKDFDSVKDFLNELVIWRELAHNFCYYNKNYSIFEGLPNWCKTTLLEHKKDLRQFIYSLESLENANTHDKYWNAAQLELVKTGKMHGYMRMYWGKKVIEWVEKPELAYKYLVYLNNKYELDGRDAGGYAGIGWCFGLHDRPWFERPIFGKIRYMAEGGLKRKFDIDSYANKIFSIE